MTGKGKIGNSYASKIHHRSRKPEDKLNGRQANDESLQPNMFSRGFSNLMGRKTLSLIAIMS